MCSLRISGVGVIMIEQGCWGWWWWWGGDEGIGVGVVNAHVIIVGIIQCSNGIVIVAIRSMRHSDFH